MASIEWATSSGKHGVDREDALFAMLNAYLLIERFDEPRIANGIRPDLFIGPQRRRGAPLLEVMVERHHNQLFVFHVMEAKPSRLALLDETP